MKVEPARGARLDAGIDRGAALRIVVDGRAIEAFEGESVAAALFADGQRALRTTPLRREPRGVYCGIGLCFDCVMTIDGRPNVRACRTPVRDGLRVETQDGDGAWTVEGIPTRSG
jgi:predicted molibdopterin-dependent oxidoreductase YjgC